MSVDFNLWAEAYIDGEEIVIRVQKGAGGICDGEAALDREVVQVNPIVISVEVKDSDAFQELCWALPDDQQWIKFCEYASIELTCEVRDGEPVITAARFLK